MPRQARLDAPGTLHHVIVRGIEKKPIVKDDLDRATFLERMGRIALESKTPIYAWALMTNHAHILLRSGPKGLPVFMRRFLTGYAISFNRRHGRFGHLFQNRYKSIICDEDNYFMKLVRYIHLNPLRAGFVRDMAQLDRYQRSLKNNLSVNEIETLILNICKASGVHIKELRLGGRRKEVSRIRSELAIDLVKNYGVSLAETARHMGVSTSAIGNLLKRKIG